MLLCLCVLIGTGVDFISTHILVFDETAIVVLFSVSQTRSQMYIHKVFQVILIVLLWL